MPNPIREDLWGLPPARGPFSLYFPLYHQINLLYLGLLISIFSSIAFMGVLTGNAGSFAIFYSIGNIISMAG